MDRDDKRVRAAFIVLTATCIVTVLAVAVLVGVSPREGWWWDGTWLAQAQVAFNVIGAGLAGWAVIYAWRVATKQFDMMREQDGVIRRQLEMLEEQTNISKRIEDASNQQAQVLGRQEKLDQELAAITRRQADIVEGQNRIFEETRQRLLDLRFRSRLQEFGLPEIEGTVETTITWNILNGGNKTADGFYWEVYIPHSPESLRLNGGG